MSIFLTPDGKPFYGGTYFPPQPAHGMPAFRQVLAGVARAWRDERARGPRRRRRDSSTRSSSSRPARPSGDAPTARPPRHGDGRDRGELRRPERRLGRCPEVPAADDDRVPPPARGDDRRPAAARRRAAQPRRDGRRRDPRPARRRLPPLRDRRDLARPALRADALRQRPARAGLHPRLRRDRRPALRATWRRARSTTWPASSTTTDGAFAASQDADTEGVEGKTFTWTADEIRDVLGDDAAAVHRRPTASPTTGNWEGTNILSRVVPADRRPGRRGADSRPPARSCSSDARRDPSPLATTRRSPRGTGSRSAPSPTRRGISRAASGTSRSRRRRGRRDRRRPASARRPARSVVEGRPIDRRGRPRGLRPPRRRAARPVRGDVRRALVHDRPRARRHDPRPVRRPGRRLLRHRRRPRGARHPAEGRPGQRGPGRAARWRRRSCSGSRR